MTAAAFNPFPGLRPFEPDEDHLFFGRERQVDALLGRLRERHFLAVVGSSGCGKSSLVRCGLTPALHSGFMAGAGSRWRVAIMKPAQDPIGNLAASLSEPEALGTTDTSPETRRLVLEATLRRSTLGLVEAVRQARLPEGENLLVLADQFEELFRFRAESGSSKDDAALFVKLLLEAAAARASIYVVLTMRSDFIGELLAYSGLPEAVNESLYLVPRLTRDELRAAISGPTAVAGGSISQRLLLRLVNQVGDNPDHLPILQHALTRTWERHRPGEPLDIEDYEAIGGMNNALSLHADEAFEEIPTARGKKLAETMFRTLTDTSSDSRGIRRPASIRRLAEICSASETEVIGIVEIFRRSGRSLLTPREIVLDSDSVIDIPHESLMRCWKRLIDWTEEERSSAVLYRRLAETAERHEQQASGLWRDPELELGLEWKRRNNPTSAWADLYNPGFERAMRFLDLSERERIREREERERARREKLRRAWLFSAALAVLLVVALAAAGLARRESARAGKNLQTAKNAVDEMLSSAGRQQARVAADTPQAEQFRKELLEKAQTFYSELTSQNPADERLKKEIALAHFRLGDIQRLLRQTAGALAEYEQTIVLLGNLSRDFPTKPEYRQALANAYNWLGETQRPQARYRTQAQESYDNAIRLQTALTLEIPGNVTYRQELARSHYNRGILLSDNGGVEDSDFREAIRLLESLATQQPEAAVFRQELARSENNMARLLRRKGQPKEAQQLYEKAIAIHEALLGNTAENREYALELASFYNNLAILLQEEGQFEAAGRRNEQAIGLFENLANTTLGVAIELAHAHDVRGRILESQAKNTEADEQYRKAIETFERFGNADSAEFHLRFGEALFNLAALQQQARRFDAAARLLNRASAEHAAGGAKASLAYDYLLLTRTYIAMGATGEARGAFEKLSALLPELSQPDRDTLAAAAELLRNQLKTN